MVKIAISHGDNIVDCRHCSGTGVCERAFPIRNAKGRLTLTCDTCGEGLEGFMLVARPTCKVCGGVGQVRF